MPYIHFSEQEKQAANEADLVSYLHLVGESTEQHGREHWWESPSGKVSIKGSDWYSQYERVGGGAVSFLQKFYGMSYPDAVQTLLGKTAGVETSSIPRQPKQERQKKPFEVPPKHTDMRRVYAYLMGERCIDRDVIHAFAHKGLIYEDAEHHNVVFVGLDENGEPRHIQKRATNSASSFKGNADSSNADYSFNYVGTSEKLFVFEAPIDLLAYLSLYKKNWEQHSYVALCSTAECALGRMLKSYPHIKEVYLCLDHDSAGIEGACRLADWLHEKGDYGVWRAMPDHKDWDEDLKALQGKNAIPASEHLGLENMKDRCLDILSTDTESDETYLELSESRGYLFEQAFRKLRGLLGRIENTDDKAFRRELLRQMAHTAVAYCYCRDRQMNQPMRLDQYAEMIRREYKPYRDKQRSQNQLTAVQDTVCELEREIYGKETVTQREVREQNQKVCRLAMLCIQMDGTLGRELAKELSQAPTPSMSL